MTCALTERTGVEVPTFATPVEDWGWRLGSGLYEQAHGALRIGDTFCAVGVLADVAVDHGLGKWVPIGNGRYGFDPAQRPGSPFTVSLPAYVLSALGVRASAAYRATMNNDRGWSFRDIARSLGG